MKRPEFLRRTVLVLAGLAGFTAAAAAKPPPWAHSHQTGTTATTAVTTGGVFPGAAVYPSLALYPG